MIDSNKQLISYIEADWHDRELWSCYVTENPMIGYPLDMYGQHIDDEEDSVSKSIIRIDSHISQKNG